MYNVVTVIGIGTLGGFLTKNISELDFVKQINLVDHDTVEGKNVFKSIYRPTNIGEYKVDALARNIEDDVTVTKFNMEYIEGVTPLPKSDLVIDCRDIVCNRGKEIDVRFYISGRILIVDCRGITKTTCDYDGSYAINLKKNEIKKAAFFASQLIEDDDIERMITNGLVQKVDLDILSSVMTKSIQRTIDNRIDMIYETTGTTQRLQCIEENVKPILEINRIKPIEVFVGEKPKKDEWPIKFAETKYAIVPKGSMLNSSDVITTLTEIVDRQPGVANFIVSVRRKNENEYIELLEETGAA